MFTRKMYVTGSASGNGIVTLLVPTAATIVAILWAARFNSITDGAQVNLELSLASASEIGLNGAQQCVSEIAWESNFVTSGLSQNAVNMFVPVRQSMRQGQLLYMHALVAGTVVHTTSALIYFG